MIKQFIITLFLLALANAAHAETISVSVNGLVCGFCASGIEKTFKAQTAVNKVRVDLNNKLITVDTKPESTMDDATVTKLLIDSGYTVTNIVRSK